MAEKNWKYCKEEKILKHDATIRSNLHYTDVIRRTINEADKEYLNFQTISDNHENLNSVINVIKNIMTFLKAQNKNLHFGLTNGGSYDVKASKILKAGLENLYFWTCFAHMLHNCAMKIKNVCGYANS